LTVCHWSMEMNERREIPLDSCALQVNGDDCVLADPTLDHGLMPVWESCAKYFGLEKSIGKTFFSPDFILINSRRFLRFDSEFRSVPFINFALAHAKAKDGSNTKQLWDFKGLTTKMKQSCPSDLYSRLFLDFVDTNQDKLMKIDLFWFLPCWLGGLGIDPPSDYWKSKEGKFARQVAFMIRQNHMKEIRSLPMDAASLLWQKSRELQTDEDHLFRLTGDEPSLELAKACGRALMYKTLLKDIQILDLNMAKDKAHATLDSYHPDTDPNAQFVNECWKVLRHNKKCHQKTAAFVLSHPKTPRIRVSEFIGDVPQTYTFDLSDSDFPRSAVLININNHLAKYHLVD